MEFEQIDLHHRILNHHQRFLINQTLMAPPLIHGNHQLVQVTSSFITKTASLDFPIVVVFDGDLDSQCSYCCDVMFPKHVTLCVDKARRAENGPAPQRSHLKPFILQIHNNKLKLTHKIYF